MNEIPSFNPLARISVAAIGLFTTFTASQIPCWFSIPFVIYGVPAITPFMATQTFKLLTLPTRAIDYAFPNVNATGFVEEHLKPVYLSRWGTGISFPVLFKTWHPVLTAFLPINNDKQIRKIALVLTSVSFKLIDSWPDISFPELSANFVAQSAKNGISVVCSVSPVDKIPYLGPVMCTTAAGVAKDLVLIGAGEESFSPVDIMCNIPKAAMKELHKFLEDRLGAPFKGDEGLNGIGHFLVSPFLPRGFLTKMAEKGTKEGIKYFKDHTQATTVDLLKAASDAKEINSNESNNHNWILDPYNPICEAMDNINRSSLKQKDAICAGQYISDVTYSHGHKSDARDASWKEYTPPELTEGIVLYLLGRPTFEASLFCAHIKTIAADERLIGQCEKIYYAGAEEKAV